MGSAVAFTRIERFMDKIQGDFPYARIIYSSLFPRTIGSGMESAERTAYNIEACIFGEMATSACVAQRRRIVLNRVLWVSPSEGKEKTQYFSRDGLHLNLMGKRAVLRDWAIALNAW